VLIIADIPGTMRRLFHAALLGFQSKVARIGITPPDS
jgi:hypothetical protein